MSIKKIILNLIKAIFISNNILYAWMPVSVTVYFIEFEDTSYSKWWGN